LLAPLRGRKRPPESSFVAAKQLLNERTRAQDPRVGENSISARSRRLNLSPTSKSADQSTANQLWSSSLSESISDKPSICRQRVIFTHAKPREDMLPVVPWIPDPSHNDGMPTPRILTEFGQVSTQSRPKRIQMNVANQFLEVRVPVADNRFVTVFKQMAVPPVPPVETYCITRKEPPHEDGQPSRTSSDKEMNMIWKQRPRIDARSRDCRHMPKPRDKHLSILVIPNDETLLCPADDDVMQRSWGIQPGTSRHESSLLAVV
jgi:hypothetical protein